MKKVILAVLAVSLSGALFIYQPEIFQLVGSIEKEKTMNPMAAAGILIALKTLATPLGFPGIPLTLLAGSLFGPYFGTIISLIGNTFGAGLAFLLARYVLQDYVQKKLLPRHPKIKQYERKMTEQGFVTVVILRLIPLFPFNALNFMLGVTRISFKNYVWGSFLGMIPGTFLFVYFGNSLRMLRLTNIILAAMGILALTYLGRLYGKEPKQFDVIVIGAGSGGLNIAGFMNRVGLRVLLIDKEDRAIGGDCLNFGCVPSKALIHVARLIRALRQAERFGMSGSGEIDMKKVMEYVDDKKEFIRQKENAAYLRNLGMTVALGKASFAGPQTVEVNGSRYHGKKIVIATGSRPRHLDIPGIKAVKVYNNENIFSIGSTPKKMVVVGAGPIGVEIGQAMGVFGSEVTIIGSGLLDKEDPEIVAPLKESLERDGVKLLLGYRPIKIEGGRTLVICNEQGEEQKIPFDMLFESIGRKFNFSELNLEKAGIAVDKKGKMVVDEYLRTTNRNVLACGDAAGRHMFTHAAELHAAVIIKNFFSPWKKKLDTDAMAWVTYSSPEIATFGLSERTLQARKVAYEVVAKDFSESDYSIVNDDTSGKIKLFLSPKGIILGGSIVASNAGELAQELMLAQSNGIKIKAFMNKVYPYPTAARINRSLVLDHMSKKLTGSIKKLLRFLFH